MFCKILKKNQPPPDKKNRFFMMTIWKAKHYFYFSIVPMLSCNELDTALWTNCQKSIVTQEDWLSRQSNDSNVAHLNHFNATKQRPRDRHSRATPLCFRGRAAMDYSSVSNVPLSVYRNINKIDYLSLFDGLVVNT